MSKIIKHLIFNKIEKSHIKDLNIVFNLIEQRYDKLSPFDLSFFNNLEIEEIKSIIESNKNNSNRKIFKHVYGVYRRRILWYEDADAICGIYSCGCADYKENLIRDTHVNKK
jgi:tRNA(Ile)-lysidine synthase TilS/MesJ